MKDERGITLIELVIFIIVGGLFVPLVYIAFNSVIKNLTTPETVIKARFIAEAKIEDITKEVYDNIALAAPAYTAVNTDPRFTDASYSGYEWRWEITDIVFQDNTGTTPYTTTIASTPQNTWAANTQYNPGAYVRPTTANGHFYRVYFPKWQANTPYRNGNNIIPTTWNGHVYRLALNYPTWQANTQYTPTSSVFPSTYNEFFYKVVPPSKWQASASYSLNRTILSSDNQYIYRCDDCCFWDLFCRSGSLEPNWNGRMTVMNEDFCVLKWSRIQLQSGSTEPAWPTTEGQTITDNNITWRAYSMRSDATEPTWLTGTGSVTTDKNLLWLEDTSMRSSTTEPTWPTITGGFTDDNSLKWVESNVYKLIKVYVRAPDCGSDACAYIATNVVTGRNYATRP